IARFVAVGVTATALDAGCNCEVAHHSAPFPPDAGPHHLTLLEVSRARAAPFDELADFLWNPYDWYQLRGAWQHDQRHNRPKRWAVVVPGAVHVFRPVTTTPVLNRDRHVRHIPFEVGKR